MLVDKTMKDSQDKQLIPLNRIGITFFALLLTQWITTDLVHLPFTGLGIFATAIGLWYFSKSSKPSFDSPTTVKGWIDRCKDVLGQFESLEDHSSFSANSLKRSNELLEIVSNEKDQSIAFTGTDGNDMPTNEFLRDVFSEIKPLDISSSNLLPLDDESWSFPSSLFNKDQLVYLLPLPLRAVDLIWLKNIPEINQSWILISWPDSSTLSDQIKMLHTQLPENWKDRILCFNGSSEHLKEILNPVKNILKQSERNKDITKQRLLSGLHRSWQSELEDLRRIKFKSLQNRSQWLVAGAVFASPVPTTDLLSVAVVNGLMIKEMANIWSCKLKPELLKEVAKQLCMAALAQGVVEWSGQALLSFSKLHGVTWLAAGTIQSLNAAYMTRVVGRSMADWMALNNGVSEPDLNLLKKQAPELVASAVRLEKVDWTSFIKQSSNWLKEQKLSPGFN